MKSPYKLFSIILILTFTLFGCLKNNHEELLNEELKKLKEYLVSKSITVAPTNSGLYYVEEIEGSGIQPLLGDYVLVNYTGTLLDGEIVFNTSIYQVAFENSIENENFLYGPLKFQYGYVAPIGLNEGIGYMREGGKSRMFLPSTLGFGHNDYFSIPAYSTLIYDIELEKVITDPVAFENSLIQQYLVDNSIDALPDDDGLYYIETLEGTGMAPTTSSTVDVMYTAYLLDGREVKSSGTEVEQIKLNAYLQGFISALHTVKGFRDGILKMKEGGEAIIIVPYNIGFGINSVDVSELGYKYPLPPYATLVFEVQLVEIH